VPALQLRSMRSFVDSVAMVVFKVAGVLGPSPCLSVTTPATCGDAIDVPLIVLVAVSLVLHALVMSSPGAKTSTQVPKLEKEERRSSSSVPLWATVVAPTVMAGPALPPTPPGDPVHASALEFPAAKMKDTPPVTAALTALSRAVDFPPPRDMLALEGLPLVLELVET